MEECRPNYSSVSYEEFIALRNEVQVLNEALNKSADLQIKLLKILKEVRNDTFISAKKIEKLQVESAYMQSLDKDIESLWEYVEKMSNHIKELERSKKGFIRRFFDKFRLIKHDDLDIKKHKSKQKFTLNDD